MADVLDIENAEEFEVDDEGDGKSINWSGVNRRVFLSNYILIFFFLIFLRYFIHPCINHEIDRIRVILLNLACCSCLFFTRLRLCHPNSDNPVLIDFSDTFDYLAICFRFSV